MRTTELDDGSARWGEAVATRPLGPDTVAICMATHRPDPALFARQIGSILDQTHDDWVLVIADESGDSTADAEACLPPAARRRAIVLTATRRLGFALNFERAARLCPPEVGHVAFCDQDDWWRPDKLACLRAAIGNAKASLVFSDYRVVSDTGAVIAERQSERMPPNHGAPLSLALSNTISGASMMARRDLLDHAIPFPRVHDTPHDHWLALVALATSGVHHAPETLFDYVQHGANTIGFNHVINQRKKARDETRRLRETLAARHPADKAGLWSDFEALSHYHWYVAALEEALSIRLDELAASGVAINPVVRAALTTIRDHRLCPPERMATLAMSVEEWTDPLIRARLARLLRHRVLMAAR